MQWERLMTAKNSYVQTFAARFSRELLTSSPPTSSWAWPSADCFWRSCWSLINEELATMLAGTLTNPSTLCSYTLCFVCTVCNLAVLVYLLICLAKPFLLFLEANLCPRLSHLIELCHCTFLIIYMKIFLSLFVHVKREKGSRSRTQYLLSLSHIVSSPDPTLPERKRVWLQYNIPLDPVT